MKMAIQRLSEQNISLNTRFWAYLSAGALGTPASTKNFVHFVTGNGKQLATDYEHIQIS